MSSNTVTNTLDSKTTPLSDMASPTADPEPGAAAEVGAATNAVIGNTELLEHKPSASAEAGAAANAVLGTTELLEHILLQLPMRDLLFSQRVSRTWRDTIAESIKLQQALFFKPIAVKDLELHGNHFALDEHGVSRLQFLEKDTNQPITLVENPLFNQETYSLDNKGSRYNAESSIRRMFVSQPALKLIRVVMNLTGNNDCPFRHLLREEGGSDEPSYCVSSRDDNSEKSILYDRDCKLMYWSWFSAEVEEHEEGVKAGQVIDRVKGNYAEGAHTFLYVNFLHRQRLELVDNFQLEDMRKELKGGRTTSSA